MNFLTHFLLHRHVFLIVFNKKDKFRIEILTIVHCSLLTEGKRHDAGMLADSQLLNSLEHFAFSPAGDPMCLYGDPAYPLRTHLQAPFRDARLTPDMQLFNKSMSRVRVSVEWTFGDIVRSFKFLDFKNNLKLGLSAVGKMYIVCSIIQNALTCMYGNQTSEYFGMQPPTVQEYFS